MEQLFLRKKLPKNPMFHLFVSLHNSQYKNFQQKEKLQILEKVNKQEQNTFFVPTLHNKQVTDYYINHFITSEYPEFQDKNVDSQLILGYKNKKSHQPQQNIENNFIQTDKQKNKIFILHVILNDIIQEEFQINQVLVQVAIKDIKTKEIIKDVSGNSFSKQNTYQFQDISNPYQNSSLDSQQSYKEKFKIQRKALLKFKIYEIKNMTEIDKMFPFYTQIKIQIFNQFQEKIPILGNYYGEQQKYEENKSESQEIDHNLTLCEFGFELISQGSVNLGQFSQFILNDELKIKFEIGLAQINPNQIIKNNFMEESLILNQIQSNTHVEEYDDNMDLIEYLIYEQNIQ
ncbi:hypothetical protein PPERSA_02456 [Pseudocohnilembus persalinus]|uniref:Uncharacterized protein n=1 Tax=Pseudocohnilembus persalinus TaxID=266149 RepID=A0A0V0QAX2_PSEPJ|nr:hypothetical protein PPERSA_02456 [Pseudocohnilembus persalinus]|eukprot:KRW99344.1 hypothetical protein PPERSA_02456 [Pseudocohnilembus persalinus]